MIERGHLVTLAAFEQPWLKARVSEMGERLRCHRKLWEFAVIAQVYKERVIGMGDALGFGCGREPLPKWLSAQGARVVATDRFGGLGAWEKTNQLMSVDLGSNIQTMDIDMNFIPNKFMGNFDFVWSTGSFEHIGGLQKSTDFFLNQLNCLRPGGVCVHTTEYNYRANSNTLDTPDLVLFRPEDIRHIERKTRELGFRMPHTDLVRAGLDDNIIDYPPYDGEPHININLFNKFVSTSIVLIAERPYENE